MRFDMFGVYLEPEDYFDRIVGIELLAGEELNTISEERLAEIAAESRAAQRKFFVTMARWDPRMKITHGAGQYANDFHAPLLAAGYNYDEVARLLIRPFERSAEDLFERAAGPGRFRVFEHTIGDVDPVLPPIPA